MNSDVVGQILEACRALDAPWAALMAQYGHLDDGVDAPELGAAAEAPSAQH
jgi:hypothetical protein